MVLDSTSDTVPELNHIHALKHMNLELRDPLGDYELGECNMNMNESESCEGLPVGARITGTPSPTLCELTNRFYCINHRLISNSLRIHVVVIVTVVIPTADYCYTLHTSVDFGSCRQSNP